jgi:hypothetical protein
MSPTIVACLCLIALTAIGRAQATGESDASPADAAEYTGHDLNGIPRYTRRAFTLEERALLRVVYGIEDPSNLYVSDSSAEAQLKYDPRRKPCARCYVSSYRIGFASVRRPTESWEDAERRIARMRPSDFSPVARLEDRSTAHLDPAIRGDVEQMLADALRAGFVVRVAATYRSLEREAFLMRARRGSTHTLTSLHAYGRAIDLVVGDGNPRRARTRAQWAAFRRWVAAYRGGEFRILGTPDNTWDWPHVELPKAEIGFPSIDAAIERARECRMPASTTPCDFIPRVSSPQ